MLKLIIVLAAVVLILYLCGSNKDTFLNLLGAQMTVQDITPNACVDLMEKGATQMLIDECRNYSDRCDAKNDIWHSPVVGAEVAELYNMYGLRRSTPITSDLDSKFKQHFQSDLCINPITCSSSAECPYPLNCSSEGKCE